MDVAPGDRHPTRGGPLGVLPDNPILRASLLVPPSAGRANPVPEAGIDRHPGADEGGFDPGTHRIDEAGSIGPQHMRALDRHTGNALEGKPVEAVEGGRLEPNPDLTGTGNRLSDLHEPQPFESTVLRETEPLHGLEPPSAGRRRHVEIPPRSSTKIPAAPSSDRIRSASAKSPR